jgi:hypothetical protein
MTACIHRNEEKSDAKTEESRESLVQLLNSVEVEKAERNKSFLSGDQNGIYIPTIERVVLISISRRPLRRSRATKEHLG